MKLKNILLSAILLTSTSLADDMAVKQEGIKYIKNAWWRSKKPASGKDERR